jgi:hypothetical protein
MTPMSSTAFLAPPMFLTINPTARPIAAFAMFPGLNAPELQLMLRSLLILPLMARKGAHEPVLTSNVSNLVFGSARDCTVAIKTGM